MKKLLSIVLSLLLVMALPLQVMAEEYNLETGSITIRTDDSGQQTVTQENGVQNHVEQSPTVIYQGTKDVVPTDSTSNTITINGGGRGDNAANVEINNVNIAAPKDTPAIQVTDGTDANLTITGSNTVQGGDYGSDTGSAGVEVESGNSITISGTGSLEATGSEHAAGIGGSQGQAGGEVIIMGGEITANGGITAAGIGGAFNRDGGTVIISGGEVTANGGNSNAGGPAGAGIGGGGNANGGITTVYGGTVKATGGDSTVDYYSGGTGIGGGGGSKNYDGKISGTTTITGGIVTANAGTTGSSCASPSQDIGGSGGNTTGTGTLDHQGGTLITSEGTEVKPDLPIPEQLLPPKSEEADPEPKPEPEPVEETPAAPSFWDTLLWKVNSAEEGSTLTIDLGSYTYIANTILKAAQKRSITLIIQWEVGEDITVLPTDTIDLTMWRVELADLIK